VQLDQVVRAADVDLHVPALCDVEVAAAVRRALLHGVLTHERAAEVVNDYLDLPLTRHGHAGLVGRVLELRENFTAYDATYVALSERLGGSFLTGDQRLARAARSYTQVPIAGPQ
jgi:predicted nucleic acid-binding protein